MPTDVINPYIDIPIAPLENKSNTRYGSDYFRDVNELQVGMGSSVMRVDQQGLWLGAERFQDAPFSVDMEGNVIATSLSLGTLAGDLDDIADGSSYKKTTVTEVLGASYAYGGLNSSGEIIKGFLNSQLSSKSLPANGVRVDNSGIYGRKSSSTTFYIDSVGNAYFTGDLVSSTMTASTITGSTITGTTLTTATSGQRVVLTSTFASYYNSSGTNIVNTYASSNSFMIQGAQSASSIILDAGSSGAVNFRNNGTGIISIDSNGIYPNSNGVYDLGSFGFRWADVWFGGDLVGSGSILVGSHIETTGGRIRTYNGSVQSDAGFFNLAIMSGATADARSDYQNGSMYYRSDHVIRVRINGTWRTVSWT